MAWKILLILLLSIVAVFLLIPNKAAPSFDLISPQVKQIVAKYAEKDNLQKEPTWVLIATGDVIPARSVNWQAIQHKDFTWPYLKTADVLKSADVTFINLESPLIDNCPMTNEGMIFCGDSRNVEGLVYAGVDIASLANNHAGNYGAEGVAATKKLLNDEGILVTGVSGTQVMDVKGVKVALLGYNDIGVEPGISNTDDEKIKSEIAQAKRVADVVIVAFHWGTEYQDQPNERQKYLGHLAIDSGADLVIGNHPHWVQPSEEYKGKFIKYAHGNFVFDQEWSLKTKQGAVGKYTFDGNKLKNVEFMPILIENYGQPHFVN